MGKKKGIGSFYSLLSIAGILCALMFVLLAVARNVSYDPEDARIPLLNAEGEDLQEGVRQISTLVLYEEDAMGKMGLREMEAVLSQMKVGYTAAACGSISENALENYEYLVLSVTNYQNLGKLLGEVRPWVLGGGNLMILYPPEVNGSFQSLFDLLGIRDCGSTNVYVNSLRFSPEVFLGASRDFPVADGYDSALGVSLTEDCQVIAQTAEGYPNPIIWRREAGQGSIVVDNLGYLEKGYRGFHAGAFSLLGESFVYPVINAAAFYIDDFPAPVPEGYSDFLGENLSIRDFYTSRWWPDVYSLADAWGIRYTGLVIEEYSDRVSGPFSRNMDRERFSYFGNMLLNAGGEIGLHGFNHMPLVLENFDYGGAFDSYRQWPGKAAMEDALKELAAFCAGLYPGREFGVYVPPSNIISPEGIDMLAETFPEIKAIASVYLPGDLAYEQEFRVEDNGIISTPRIISGYILDDYSRLIALSELNFHFVSSHFQHPDDVMDEDRGAALGWEQMFRNLTDYVRWLYSSVPAIRSLTGSETAAAVERYDYVELTRQETENGIRLDLMNFFDEAWFFLRLNKGQEIAGISGGQWTELNDTLYLIRAEEGTVEVTFLK